MTQLLAAVRSSNVPIGSNIVSDYMRGDARKLMYASGDVQAFHVDMPRRALDAHRRIHSAL
eukprot:9490456-Pyramimonas_sp.AAC.1